MTDTVTSQNIDLSSWDTLYIYIYIYVIPSVTLHDTSYSLCYLQPVGSCPNFCVEQVRNACFYTLMLPFLKYPSDKW